MDAAETGLGGEREVPAASLLGPRHGWGRDRASAYSAEDAEAAEQTSQSYLVTAIGGRLSFSGWAGRVVSPRVDQFRGRSRRTGVWD